jgi:nephrocystin-4
LGPYPVCKAIQLSIAFYDMPTYKTPFLHLEYYNDDRNFKFNLENGTPLRLLHNNESFSCKFTIEASLQRY